MKLFKYVEAANEFFVLYPHITVSVKVETAFDGEKAVVFEDTYAMKEFLNYLEDNSVDVSDLEAYAFDSSWEETAFMLNDLLELK
jgi:hypothetical protein